MKLSSVLQVITCVATAMWCFSSALAAEPHHGDWILEAMIVNGNEVSAAQYPDAFETVWRIEEGSYTIMHKRPQRNMRWTYKCWQSGSLTCFEATYAGDDMRIKEFYPNGVRGLFKVTGDTMTRCYTKEKVAPKDLDSKSESNVVCMRFRRK